MDVKLVKNGQKIQCPAVIDRDALLKYCNVEHLIPARVISLKDGNCHRTFTRLAEGLINLAEYQELWLPSRELFAIIELKAEEHEPCEALKRISDP